MFNQYQLNGIFDEMFEAADVPRPHYEAVFGQLVSLGNSAFQRRRRMADLSFRNQGITLPYTTTTLA